MRYLSTAPIENLPIPMPHAVDPENPESGTRPACLIDILLIFAKNYRASDKLQLNLEQLRFLNRAVIAMEALRSVEDTSVVIDDSDFAVLKLLTESNAPLLTVFARNAPAIVDALNGTPTTRQATLTAVS